MHGLMREGWRKPVLYSTRFAAAARYTALLDRSGLLINSHDPLRGHVLKHIRRTTPDRPVLLGGAQGNKSEIQNLKSVQ